MSGTHATIILNFKHYRETKMSQIIVFGQTAKYGCGEIWCLGWATKLTCRKSQKLFKKTPWNCNAAKIFCLKGKWFQISLFEMIQNANLFRPSHFSRKWKHIFKEGIRAFLITFEYDHIIRINTSFICLQGLLFSMIIVY